MIERTFDIETKDGKMETFITHPEIGGPFPAVIIYMDIWGVREELYDIARRIATVGYAGVVHDAFYRHGKKRFEFRDEAGKMMSGGRIDPDIRAEIIAIWQSLTDSMVVEDTNAIIEVLDGDANISDGPMGCVGYCMGGRHVMAVAGHRADRFRASMSLHGTNLVTDDEDSPHLLADRFQGELYCGFGEKDTYATPEVIETLDRVLGAAEVDYSYLVHAGAEHGYALPDRDIFDKSAAERDWERFFAMLRRQAPPT
ncbi:MAG: dienelactone hydrolase family protein [Rhodospirillales bacterium]|nr:dienelactone hydrolase family protein [Rhodospirillales bacterium]